MKKFKILFFIFLLSGFLVLINEDIIAEGSKKLPKIEEYGVGGNIIRYSNVILNLEGKKIKIPIYGGIYEDVEYAELEKKNKNFQLLNGIVIPVKKGQLKSKFNDLISFYKKSLLKGVDVNKPSLIAPEGNVWIIWYDFKYEGITSSMQIIIAMDYESTKKKLNNLGLNIDQLGSNNFNINMLEFDENFDWISLRLIIGEGSGF